MGSSAAVESPDAKARTGIGPLLRELGAMLVEPSPREVSARPVRMGVSIERTAAVAGLQAILLPTITAPILFVVEPTGPIGDWGWVLAFAGVAGVVAVGLRFVANPDVSARALAASNVFAAGVIGVLAWLTGGLDSPYPLLLPLIASSIAPHRPRVRRGLILWILLVTAAPLVYDGPATSGQAATVIMIAAASVATLLTMVWLSSRVSRSEAGLMNLVSDAREAQEEMAAEADRLVEAGVIRDQLVTRVSHELRTPLTSVKGYVEALLEGEGGELEPEQRELADIALRNTTKLELLIADLLLLSRVEAGQLELRAKPVEVRSSLQAVSADLGQLAQEGGVSLIVEATPEFVWELDRERFEQAVANMISNAIKYSPGGGPVLVRGRQVDSELWVEVVDKGVGIPEDEVSRLGQRFFRASTAGDVSGTGLGIAITQELVELHMGTLEVESEVGSGSIFRIRIPGGLEARSVGEAEREPYGLE
jgi:signal transduction histidine kinase